MTPAAFRNKTQLGATLFELEFLPERPINFIPGQFIEVILPESDSHDNRGHRRWFSLASSPNEKTIRIITRFTPENTSSFKQKLFSLTNTSSVLIAGAMGDFVLPKDVSIPTIWVAAGVGIAPFISMNRFISSDISKRAIHLFWTTSQDEPLPYRAELLANTKAIFIFDKNQSLKTNDIVNKVDDSSLASGLFYVAGPEMFVESFTRTLTEAGIPRHRIVADYFHGYNE